MPIESVNDFVVRFANVNGSGSASANELFARSVVRMGVPVSPRNIFPSNIQGLPTWYEVRITERANSSLALADPDPLTLANRTTKSFTLWIGMLIPLASFRSGISACPTRRSGNARRTARNAGTHPRP